MKRSNPFDTNTREDLGISSSVTMKNLDQGPLSSMPGSSSLSSVSLPYSQNKFKRQKSSATVTPNKTSDVIKTGDCAPLPPDQPRPTFRNKSWSSKPKQPKNQISKIARTRLDGNKPEDAKLMVRRGKQIDKGKMTAGYGRYVDEVKKSERIAGDPKHPQTPDITEGMSNRSWNGYMSAWRRALHLWDPEDLSSEPDEFTAEKEREVARHRAEMEERKRLLKVEEVEREAEIERNRLKPLDELLEGGEDYANSDANGSPYNIDSDDDLL